ncbi:MAG TPA: SUMF1/EgtB/PvdO family nonheme iron enzyme [Fibrobacteria bacterium]|nr:SUMF1/EgtB/PvdO family nonheme iron enzyme [Fibrobacteria bacterium]
MLRLALGVVAGMPAVALAMSKLTVENAAVGQKTLVLTVDDSIHTPDLGKLLIEGYSVENAVFLDEGDAGPIQFTPQYLDMTLPGNGRIVDFHPAPGVVVLDAPTAFVPQPGAVLADTAFGGLFRKVVRVDGSPQPGVIGRKWTLVTVDAELPDAVRNADLSFSTRVDLNQVLPDLDRAEEVMGYLPDGSSTPADAEFRLRKSQILFQPTVTGRIRIVAGRVEEFSIQVAGDCEVAADAQGAFHGRGELNFEEDLPVRPAQVLSLGNGLFLRVANRPSFRMEAQAEGEGLAARAEFRIRNTLKSELAFSKGQWRPLAENRMTSSSRAAQELKGEGSLKMVLEPRLEVLFAGVHGPSLTFSPYARFVSSPDSASALFRGQPAPSQSPGLDSATAARTLANLPPTASSLSPQVPPTAGLNRELSLGADILMDSRTTFSGPPLPRRFVLFSREQILYAPPREGSLSLKEVDSGRVLLMAQTFPKADRFAVQQRLGAGPWETVLEVSAGQRIRLGNLKPSTAYRFRVIGFNAMGTGPAFPPEGLPFTTPAYNHPPLVPFALLPDSGAALTGSSVVLSWRGGDADPGAKVHYTVLLDTRQPPLSARAAGLTDSVLTVSDLKPGTYFWRVIAGDGVDRTEGPVRGFTLSDASVAAPMPAEARSEVRSTGYRMVTIPRGGFRREDGREVTVGPFLIGKFEVTQAEYEKAMGRNPSYRMQDSLPVERVTWEEAATFCNELGGRLPTEAEWEYAARAGAVTAYYWGQAKAGDYAWYRDNSENRTQKVGQKKPNDWGLHDMAGNVFEWVQDWYGDYSATGLDHPRGPGSGVAKVIRGASWYSESGNLDLASRYSNRPGFRNFKVGFRCAKDPDSPSTAVPAARDPGAAASGTSSQAAPESKRAEAALPAVSPVPSTIPR